MSYFERSQIQFADTGSIDAFARARVSNPFTVFDSKLIYDERDLVWDESEVSGSGTSTSYSTDTASVTMSVSNTTAGKRVRQTKRWFNYQPGKSQLAIFTGVIGEPTTGIIRQIGMFNDDNGLFFESGETDISVVIRSNTSGSPVDTSVAQSSWNLDTLDGTGISGVTLDPSKAQVFFLDFEWLGVGRVRMGFFIDGLPIYVHEFNHANSVTNVYMSTPNLPVRYTIENDGSGAAASIKVICSSIVSEGGNQETGQVRAADLGTSFVNANTSGTSYALIGLRLKSTHLGATIETLTASLLSATNDLALYEILLNPTVAGTFTYADESDSAVQVALGDTAGNPSTNTVTGGTLLASGYIVQDQAIQQSIRNELRLGSFIDGTRDEIVLACTPIGANLDVYGSISWREQY